MRQGRDVFAPGFDIKCCSWKNCVKDRVDDLPVCENHRDSCICNRETGEKCVYHGLKDEGRSLFGGLFANSLKKDVH